MNYKSYANDLLAKFGYRLISTQRTGIDYVNEIRRTGVRVEMVLDVGANVGLMSRKFLQQFPGAEIHAFEPVSSNFTTLLKITDPRLHAYRLAMAAKPEKLKIYIHQHHCMHSAIVAEDNNQYELIEATSVDLFCDERGIERVGLLKIDTEGSDLDILVGATRLLSRSGIDFIVVEVGFYEKQRHVGLCQFLEWLTPLGYHLFGVYEQSWQRGGAARIDFANALFAREGLIAYK